jgi:hypothetical protein
VATAVGHAVQTTLWIVAHHRRGRFALKHQKQTRN